MEAWAWLSERNAPDLIVYGINGKDFQENMELIENIRLSGLYSDIPLVILSDIKDEGWKQQCLNLGVISHISKPFDPQFFISEIQRGLLHDNEVVFID